MAHQLDATQLAALFQHWSHSLVKVMFGLVAMGGVSLILMRDNVPTDRHLILPRDLPAENSIAESCKSSNMAGPNHTVSNIFSLPPAELFSAAVITTHTESPALEVDQEVHPSSWKHYRPFGFLVCLLICTVSMLCIKKEMRKSEASDMAVAEHVALLEKEHEQLVAENEGLNATLKVTVNKLDQGAWLNEQTIRQLQSEEQCRKRTAADNDLKLQEIGKLNFSMEKLNGRMQALFTGKEQLEHDNVTKVKEISNLRAFVKVLNDEIQTLSACKDQLEDHAGSQLQQAMCEKFLWAAFQDENFYHERYEHEIILNFMRHENQGLLKRVYDQNAALTRAYDEKNRLRHSSEKQLHTHYSLLNAKIEELNAVRVEVEHLRVQKELITELEAKFRTANDQTNETTSQYDAAKDTIKALKN